MAWAPHILLVAVTTFALMIIFSNWGVPAPATRICMDVEMREHMRGLMVTGLDAAFKEKTAQLFDNRLRDIEKNPDRILAGMRNTIVAYTHSRDVVKKWSPPPC